MSIFDGGVAVQGGNSTRASDHLPVSAILKFGDGSTPPVEPAPDRQVHIVALLPNPSGPDPGNEEVHIKNGSAEAISLDGWSLQDLANHEFALSGEIASNETRTFVLPEGVMPLNNTGDIVLLFDQDGTEVDDVAYERFDVEPGTIIEFQ